MIKVTRASGTPGEVELIVKAGRFFIDRLIPVAKQKKLTLNIQVTEKPGRVPIAIDSLVGSQGLFGVRPPRYFEMTVSAAAGVRDGLEIAANEIIHLAQIINGRLKICLKKRKVNGEAEEAYAASWLGGRFSFVDMTPRSDRSWELEAAALKVQLVEEFQSWTSNTHFELPTQKLKKNQYGLYPVRSKIVNAPVKLPENSRQTAPEYYQTDNDLDHTQDNVAEAQIEQGMIKTKELSAMSRDQTEDIMTPKKVARPFHLTDPIVSDNAINEQPVEKEMSSPTSREDDLDGNMSSADPPNWMVVMEKEQLTVNHLQIESGDFKIIVEVPRLGVDRVLDGTMFHDKLNDLLERGLIPHDAARAAFSSAQLKQNRS